MKGHMLYGQLCLICSRIIIIILSIIIWSHWTAVALVLHFFVMFGMTVQPQITRPSERNIRWITFIKLAFILCFCFAYIKDRVMIHQRFFHVLIALENLGFILYYFLASHHTLLMKAIAVTSIFISSIAGIALTEAGSYLNSEKNNRDSCIERQINETPFETQLGTTFTTKVSVVECRENSSHNQSADADESNISPREQPTTEKHFEGNVNRDSLQPLGSSKTETMCSIQDLLANTSNTSNLFDSNENESFHKLNEMELVKKRSQLSINEVGLPLQTDHPNTAVRIKSDISCCPNLIRDQNHSMSKLLNPINLNEIDSAVKSKSLDEIFSQNNTGRYSTDLGSNNWVSEKENENLGRVQLFDNCNVWNEKKLTNFLPSHKPFALESNESIGAQSSSTHDYENCPTLNVYRANTGIRHWKAYFDIEDRIHDFSTFKEKSLIEDSTMSSNPYGNTFFLTSLKQGRPLSLDDNASSSHSISLPDLNCIDSPACIHVECVTPLTAENDDPAHVSGTGPQAIQNAKNYEAIWYDDLEDERDLMSEKNKLFEESLCKFYCSKEDKSQNNINRIKQNISLNNLVPQDICTVKEGTASVSNPHLPIEDVETDDLKATSDNMEVLESNKTPSNKGKRLVDMKRTQKSPLMKLMSLSQNSLHERTSRAIQAGRRVFYRPRVHVITPKKEQIRPRAFSNQLQLDPTLLRKRGQLSPKDKLILSEASALIHRRECTSGCKTTLGFTAEVVVPQQNLSTNDNGESFSSPREEAEKGPQHSTPEGNRHLPQLSILSTISSVASPEECLKLGCESRFGKKVSLSNLEDCSSYRGNFQVMQSKRSCSSKVLPEMTVIEEFESVPSQV